MNQKIKTPFLLRTPSQTAGPYFSYALTSNNPFSALDLSSLPPHMRAHCRWIEGYIWDGAGAGVAEMLIEAWHADVHGHYPSLPLQAKSPSSFTGLTRIKTNDQGKYSFIVQKPGPIKETSSLQQAPHIALVLFGRSLLRPLYTRLYFEEDSNLLQQDPLFLQIPEKERVTLLSSQIGTKEDLPLYRFNIHLQEGPNKEQETVFFEFSEARSPSPFKI